MANPDLLKYICERLQGFATEEDIKEELLRVGWPLPDIEDGFAALNATPAVPSEPQTTSPLTRFSGMPATPGMVLGSEVHRSKKWILWLVIILIILLLGGGLAFAYVKKTWPLQNGLPSFLKFSFLSGKPAVQEQVANPEPVNSKPQPPPLGPDEFLGMGPGLKQNTDLSSLSPEEKTQYEKEKEAFGAQNGISYENYVSQIERAANCEDTKTGEKLSVVKTADGRAFAGGPVGTVAIAPNGVIYAASGSACGYRSTDKGATWELFLSGSRWLGRDATGTVKESGPIDLGDLLFDQADSNHFYNAQAPLLETVNNGTTWRLLRINGEYNVHDLVIDPKNPKVRYAVVLGIYVSEKLYRTADGGATWNLLCDTAKAGKDGCPYIGKLVITPDETEVFSIGSDSLYVSKDHGTTFKKLVASAKAPQMLEFASSTLYGSAPARDEGMISLDRGVTWKTIKRPGLFYLTMNPGDTKEFFMYTDVRSGTDQAGVYHSTDGGTTWKEVKKFAPGVSIFKMVVDYEGKRVFVGTEKGLEILTY